MATKRRKRPAARTVASLAIASPGLMTDAERIDVAKWLRWQARHLMAKGRRYTYGVFASGFNYVVK